MAKDGKALPARYTYGNRMGMLVIPEGYVNFGEMPLEALKREYGEETKIEIEPENILGVRFNMRDWYLVFNVGYISGEPVLDRLESSEV